MSALPEAVRALQEAEAAVARATQARDEAVRKAIADGVPVATLAEQAGLSKARVYQIRDGRR